MYVMDRPTKWEDFPHLIKFSYNNSYQYLIKMIPFEAIYGKECGTPLSWSQMKDMLILRPNTLQEME